MFYNVSENIAFCIDISQNSTILSQIKNFTINCTNICFTEKNKKIVVEKKKCLRSCLDDNYYSYE